METHSWTIQRQRQCDVSWTQIPCTAYALKCIFSELGYDMMLTDLTFLYGEKINGTEVQERFNKLNPHVEMKTAVIVKNLSACMCTLLESNFTDTNLQFSSNEAVLRLHFYVDKVRCVFDIEMALLPADKMRDHVITPAILGGFLNHKKIVKLEKKLEELEKMRTSNKRSPLDDVACPPSSVEQDLLEIRNVSVPNFLMKSFVIVQRNLKAEIPEKNPKVKQFAAHKPYTSVGIKDANTVPLSLKRECLELKNSAVNIQYEDINETKQKKEDTDSISEKKQNLKSEELPEVKSEIFIQQQSQRQAKKKKILNL